MGSRGNGRFYSETIIIRNAGFIFTVVLLKICRNIAGLQIFSIFAGDKKLFW
jgi:hypothetical protein